MKILQKNSKILIAGCGRFGSNLASALSRSGYDIIIIDKKEDSFQRLSDCFSGFQILGDATDLSVLEDAKIEQCNMVIVATNNDNVNSMIAQIANKIYKIDQVFVRLYNSDKAMLFKHTTIETIYPVLLSMKEFERISHIDCTKGSGL